MSSLWQRFGHRESAYERPSQPWVCGRAQDGRTCRIGPDLRGQCRADFECIPLNTDDRWSCTRAPQYGGRCTDGPLPDGRCARPIDRCVPKRSDRARRGLTTLWLVCLTVGAILLLLNGRLAERVVVPGEVTYQHGDVATCDGCHTGSEHGLIGWLQAAFLPRSAAEDSAPCLACHRLGNYATKAHSLAPETLKPVTTRLQNMPRPQQVSIMPTVAKFVFGQQPKDQDLACSTCHREHHGQRYTLDEISNLHCHTCHERAFDTFVQGHPQFESFPYQRRTRIIFDHVGHIGKHFREPDTVDAPTACTGCHEPDTGGAYMLVKDFDQTCRACHGKQIAGEGRAGVKGLPVIALPGLDLQTLDARNVEIGHWPYYADGPITPFVRVLLAADPDVADALDEVSTLDLLDLLDADDHQLAAVARVAWGVKKMLGSIVVDGHDAYADRLSRVAGRQLTSDQVASLIGMLPTDAVLAAQSEWFPDLGTELARHAAGDIVMGPTASEIASHVSEPEATGDLAETPAQTTEELDLGGLLDSDGAADDAETLFDTPTAEADNGDLGGLLDDDLLADDGDLLGDDLLADGGDLLGNDGDLLGDEGLLADDDEISLSDGNAGDMPDSNDRASAPVADVDVTPLPQALRPVAPEAWSNAGGWYRQDYGLYYRPGDHADGFMRAWLDLSGMIGGADPLGAPLAQLLTNSKTVGSCTKCHSVDDRKGQNGGFLINWLTVPPQPNDKRFSVYAHVPHFSLLNEAGCLTCHILDPAAAYMASFDHRQPAQFASNFRSLDKSTCAACHKHELAGDRCTECHNYHIGDFPPALAAAPLALSQTPPSAD